MIALLLSSPLIGLFVKLLVSLSVIDGVVLNIKVDGGKYLIWCAVYKVIFDYGTTVGILLYFRVAHSIKVL